MVSHLPSVSRKRKNTGKNAFMLIQKTGTGLCKTFFRLSDRVALFDGKESSNVYATPDTSIGRILVSTLVLKFIMFKKVLLKTVLHVFLLKSKLLFLVSKNSELKAKFLFKNKATKSNKNVIKMCQVVNVVVDDIVAVGGNVVVGVTLGGSILVRVSLGGSIDVGVSL